MSIMGLIVVLIVLGLLGWAVSQLPLQPNIQKVIQVLLVVVAVIYVLQGFGVLDAHMTVR